MSNAETIAKLNDALSKLIKAYEGLQEENNSLYKTIEELEAKVEDLETDKELLEMELTELNQNKKEDGSSISTMLGKIENLLGRKNNGDSLSTVSSNTIDNKPKEEDISPQDDSEVSSLSGDDINDEKEEGKNEQPTNVAASSTNLDDIRLSRTDEKSGFGNSNSNSSYGSNSFNSAFPNTNNDKKDDDEDEGDGNNKLDLNRMASLLNGMNKR